MKYLKRFVILVALILAVIFIPRNMEVKFFAANLPSYFTTKNVARDIDYGSKNHQKLDVYMPGYTPAHKPVIVFFHGGKWTKGRKENYQFVADAFVKKGYVVVIPSITKYPEGYYKIWQEDAAKVVAWVHNNIAKFNGDAANIYLMGHSSGGQIAALIATDERYLQNEGGTRGWIKAFVGISAPYDFTPEPDDLKEMFRDSGDNYADIRVTNFIDGKQPPMLMIWGRDDDAVGDNEMLLVKNAIEKHGGIYEIKYYEDADHTSLIAALAPLSTSDEPVADDIDAWLKQLK